MPNHRMNSGTQAIDGHVAQRLDGRIQQLARPVGIAGGGAEQRGGEQRPRRSPAPPARRGQDVAASARRDGRQLAMVAEHRRGRRHQRGVDEPEPAPAPPRRAGRARDDQAQQPPRDLPRAGGRCRCGGDSRSPALRDRRLRRPASRPRLHCSLDAELRREARDRAGIDRRRHVDLGLDHARLLQRLPGGQDRCAAAARRWRPGEVGALELAGRHLVVELGGLGQDGAQLVRDSPWPRRGRARRP